MEIGCWRTLPNMDNKRKNFDYIKDPETLRDILIKTARSKLAHSAGKRYANAAIACLERETRKDYEDWEFQNHIRERIYSPVARGC